MNVTMTGNDRQLHRKKNCVSVRTHVSNASTSRSSRSQMLSAKARRLVAEQKMKALKTKQQIEKEQRCLAEKMQILEQQSEIDQARVEELMWQEEEEIQASLKNNHDQPTYGATALRTREDVSGDKRDDSTTIAPLVTVASSRCPVTPTFEDVNKGSGDIGCIRSARDGVSSNVGVQDGGRVASGFRICDGSKGTDANSMDMAVSSRSSVDGMVASDVSGIDAAFNRLASTLHEGFNLPKPELLTFNGSAIDYWKFIKHFETNIESKILDNRLRLSYLIQYCQGEAKSCIEDCVLLESDVGYERAREILQSRYGRSHVIARSYIGKLVYGPPIKSSDSNALSRLALDMQKCEITLSQLGFVSDVDNSENLRRIVRRIPMPLQTKWVDVAHNINVAGREPRFSDLVKYINEKSQIASSMYSLDLVKDNTSRHSIVKSESNVKDNVTSFATKTGSQNSRFERKCYCCSGSCTDLSTCNQFNLLSLAERRKLLHKYKLCYNCLKGKHMVHTCKKPSFCKVQECNGKHNTLLHSWVKPGSDHTVTQPSVNCTATRGSHLRTCLGIVPVTVTGENGSACQTYALLHDGADKSLCDERLLQKLGVSGRPITFKIATVSSTGSICAGREVDLHVRSDYGYGDVHLQKVWTVRKLPITTRSAASRVDVRKIPHLSDVDVPAVNVSDVMLLIGTDSPDAHVPLEVRAGDRGQPYAVRTRLGWAVGGLINDFTGRDTDTAVNVHHVQVNDVALREQLEKMWTTDFADVIHSQNVAMSIEDKRALTIMESTLIHKSDGHYFMGLPWRDENVVLPNNLPHAHVRLEHLKRKLSRDPELHKMYTATMSDYIDKDYAKPVNITDTNDRVWYLPHHPVVKENKPGKVRVVFDCAAKYKGTSLNKELLQGPDLTNSFLVY